MSENLSKADSKFIIRPWKLDPLILTRGEGVYVEDVKGRRLIDTMSAFFVLNVGYSHKEVLEAIKDQVDRIIHTTTYQSNIPIIKLAEKLAEITPTKLNRIFYTVGGAETCETAIRMAKQYTGKREIITLQASYHGASTVGSSTMTGISKNKVGFTPQVPGVFHAAAPYCYRCVFDKEYPDCGLRCAGDIERVINTETSGDVAAILVEPILGAGGAIIPHDGWLQEVERICRENDLLFIVDEIQTGFGRSGRMWAIEHCQVEPDIMCLSKTVGGGLPLGAVVTTKEIAEKFQASIPSTFAGNALAAAAGLKTIEIIERERLWKKAERMGNYFYKRFSELAEKYDVIGDVRFKGLMGGIELVKDRKSKEPAVDECWKIAYKLRELGILTFPGGISGSVFRVQPPLIITEEEAEKIINAYDTALASI